jgi:uncharacterized protein YlzI (FlbEa/FlbD family)
MIIKVTDVRGNTTYINSTYIISFQVNAQNALINKTHIKLVNGEQFYCEETIDELLKELHLHHG